MMEAISKGEKVCWNVCVCFVYVLACVLFVRVTVAWQKMITGCKNKN